MKRVISSIILLFIFIACSRNIKDATVQIGTGIEADVYINGDLGRGAANPKIRYNAVASKWYLSNDGTTFDELGGGGGAGIPLLSAGSIITSDGTFNGEFDIGLNGQILSVNTANPYKLEWVAPDGGLPLSTKGDIHTSNGAIDIALPVGVDNKILVANSATATGLEWQDATGVPLNFVGDLLTRNSTGPITLTVGANDQVLTADSGLTRGIGWKAVYASPTTTKGDIVVRDASTDIRLPVGTNGYVLSANSATGSGLEWVSGGGGGLSLTTKGDLHTYSTSEAALPVGTNGQVLSANSSAATGLEWVAPSGGGGLTTITYEINPNPANITTNFTDFTLYSFAHTHAASGFVVQGTPTTSVSYPSSFTLQSELIIRGTCAAGASCEYNTIYKVQDATNSANVGQIRIGFKVFNADTSAREYIQRYPCSTIRIQVPSVWSAGDANWKLVGYNSPSGIAMTSEMRYCNLQLMDM